MPPQPRWPKKTDMKKFKQIAEQHREKGRFRPTVPRNVSNIAAASPRPSSDSADVRLKEASAAAIAAATAISKKKSGNYDKEGMRVKPYKNPEHPKRKSNEQRRKEIKEYLDQQDPAELKGTSSGALTLLDKPNKEPMRKYKEMKINELSNELLHRYKEKAAADASKADKEGNFERGNKRFSGVVKATNKQFAKFRQKGFREETEQLDELSPATKASYKEKAQKVIIDLKPHAEKGEYKDIAKNIIQRRQAGLAKMKEEKDVREYDYEGDMAKTQLKTIIRNAQMIHDMIDDDENMPEWVQSKITLAKDYIVVSANYLQSQMNEEVEQLDEKNVPTSPEKWARAKAMAKSKFDVYPSAYANGWAAKKYKEMGGGWKSVSEEVEQIEEMKMSPHKQAVVAAGGGTPADQGIYAAQKEKPPFEGGTKTKDKVIPGKYGKGYSTARHLARMAMQKQAEKVKKPIKEESKKAKIVKDVMKKKTSEDAFQKDPELSNTLSKNV